MKQPKNSLTNINFKNQTNCLEKPTKQKMRCKIVFKRPVIRNKQKQECFKMCINIKTFYQNQFKKLRKPGKSRGRNPTTEKKTRSNKFPQPWQCISKTRAYLQYPSGGEFLAHSGMVHPKAPQDLTSRTVGTDIRASQQRRWHDSTTFVAFSSLVTP